jgi:hypothetical protein
MPVITIGIEAGLPVIATLRDMLWLAGNVQAKRAWHVVSPDKGATTLTLKQRAEYRQIVFVAVGKCIRPLL